MKKVFFGIVLAFFASQVAYAETIRMGTEGAYPPYNYIDDNGNLAGFEIILGNELCKRAALDCEWVKNDWDSIIPNLVSGNYDTIIAGMSITEERDKVIDFTQNYMLPRPSAYVAASKSADLKGIIAAQTATLQSGYIAESSATLMEFATPEETVSAVLDGEADAVFADSDYLAPIVEASQGNLVFVGEQVVLGLGTGMGIRDTDAGLKKKFNDAISSMKEDGSLNALLTEWFGDDMLLYD